MDTSFLTAQGGDFSILTLFLHATLLVKVVMILLVLASIWSWAVIITKWGVFANARRRLRGFEKAFWSGESLDVLHDRIGDKPRGAGPRIFAAGMAEWQRATRNGRATAGAPARIDRALDIAVTREADALREQLPFLATIGSTAPFVGLFGTVFGIMNSFIQIGAQQNSNIAVVAPGIAEALLATALGLMAAIPAVIFYNKFSADADRLTGRLESFADEFSLTVSREMDAR